MNEPPAQHSGRSFLLWTTRFIMRFWIHSVRGAMAKTLTLMSVLASVLLLVPVSAFSTEALTDDQLDNISAGDFTLNIGEGANGVPTVNFGFQTGGTTGNGQIVIQPSATPTTGINATNVNFNAPFHVDNMIFNMNICVQCQATTLTQGNIGVPVTVKVLP